MNTPGTLLRDAWDKVAAMPAGNLRNLAEWTYSAMIYETCWHDENPPAWWVGGGWDNSYKSRNYQVTFDRHDACTDAWADDSYDRSEEHTSELQSPCNLVCRLLLEKKK